MRFIKLWKIYSLFLFVVIFVDIFTTCTNFDMINRTIKNEAELLGYRFLMLYTKILHILECYFFGALLVQLKITNIIQIRFVKLISIMINLTLSCRLGFTASNIIYLVLQSFTFIFLNQILSDLYSDIFHKYNKSISTDVNILFRNILYESIGGCKAVAYNFLGLLMIAHITFAPLDFYFYYSIVKCLIFFIDNVLSKDSISKINYLSISLVLIGGLSIYSIMYVVYLFMNSNVLKKMAYLFNELVLLLWFLFLLIFLYIEWKTENKEF